VDSNFCGCDPENWQCTYEYGRFVTWYWGNGYNYKDGGLLGSLMWWNTPAETRWQADAYVRRTYLSFDIPSDLTDLVDVQLQLDWSSSPGSLGYKVVKNLTGDYTMELATFPDHLDSSDLVFCDRPIATQSSSVELLNINANGIADLKSLAGSLWKIGLRTYGDYDDDYNVDYNTWTLNNTTGYLPTLILTFHEPTPILPSGLEIPALDTFPSYVRVGRWHNGRTRRGCG
jgi:hypothetical protein